MDKKASLRIPARQGTHVLSHAKTIARVIQSHTCVDRGAAPRYVRCGGTKSYRRGLGDGRPEARPRGGHLGAPV